MSGAEYFSDNQAINAHMDSSVPIDRDAAIREHHNIRAALESAGIEVVKVNPPKNCQDGVYTANWALVRGNKAVMSRLPKVRQAEEAYARRQLEKLGFKTITVPDGLRFSGQGDALPCGNYLFVGSDYRTDRAVHDFLAETLGYQVVSLKTKPKRSLFGLGSPVINKASGWPDSYFYDIDLALAIIRPDTPEQPGLIAWCPAAFTRESADTIRALPLEKIEVSLHEAKRAFACNLVSTGRNVIMSARAPKLKAELLKRGFSVTTPEIHELGKGGGYIRCTTLTIEKYIA